MIYFFTWLWLLIGILCAMWARPKWQRDQHWVFLLEILIWPLEIGYALATDLIARIVRRTHRLKARLAAAHFLDFVNHLTRGEAEGLMNPGPPLASLVGMLA